MIQVSTNKKKLEIALIHKYLSEESYWGKGHPIEQAKQQSTIPCVFGMYNDDKQIGFARIVTDYTFFAWLMNAFILEEYKDNGYRIM